MVLENNCVDIDSDNEILERAEYNVGMLVCVERERERKWRKNLEVKGLQGVNFSRDIVVGGEVKASHVFRKDESSFSIYLEDDRMTCYMMK